jgi:hypothetical protein
MIDKKDKNKTENLTGNLKKYLGSLKKKVKDTSLLDFFNWCNLALLVLGLIIISIITYSFEEVTIKDLLTSIVLWFTAIVILQYTKETYWLKQTEVKNFNLQRKNSAPFVIIHFEEPDCFILKNVGGGVARNVLWKLIKKRGLFPLEEVMKYPSKTIIESHGGYTKIRKPVYGEFERSHEDCHEVIINYEDMDGVKYTTKLESGITCDDYKVLKYNKGN